MGYSNVDESRLAELQSLLDKNKITSKKKKGFQSFISDYAPIKEENRIESNTIESGNVLTNGEIAVLNKAKSKKNASAYDYRGATESILKNQLGRSADSIVDSALKDGWYDALKLSLDDSVGHSDNKSINQKWKKQLQESVAKIEFFNAVASKNGGTLPEDIQKNMDYLKTKSSDELQFMFNQMYPSEKKSGMDTSALATLSDFERKRKNREYNLSGTEKTASAILNAVPAGMENSAKGIKNSLNLILSGEAAKTAYNKVTSDVNNFKQSQVKMTDEQKEEYAKRKLSEETEALHSGTYADYSAKQKKAMAELFQSSDDSALTESEILRKQAENAAKYPILAEYENVSAPNVQNNKAALIASNLVFSGTNMLPAIAANMVLPGSGTAVIGLSSGGNAYEQALLEGKTKEQALGYGILIGTSEALTEKLLGGIKSVGGKGASKILSKLSKDTTNKVMSAVKKVAESKAGSHLLGGLSEANEEWVQANLEPIFRNIMFDENNEIKPFSEDKLEAALLGFLNASVLNAPYLFSKSNTTNDADVTKAFNTAADSKTAGNVFTDSEQAVLDKVYEKAVAEREADGSKLTDKEKSKLYDAIVDQMEKGGIDIDTIESTLGGDVYKAYKDTIDFEKKLKKELNELSDIETGKLTRNQLKRLEQLESMNLDDTTKRDSLRKQLDDTIYPLLENSRLAESYNQAERRKQAFKADLTQYKGKQRAAVERAINSGVLNNTYRSHELVDILSKIEADKGIVFDYTNNAKLKESGFAIEGKTVNGYVTKNGVTLNVQSSKAWQSVVGHEITHVLEGTDAYTGLRSALYAYAESKGELASRKSELTELYKGIDADIDAELTAELVGDYLFSDKDFINHLTENRTLFQKIYDEIKYLCKVATGKELTDMEKVKIEFDKAWKEVSGKGVDSKLKYSLREGAEIDVDKAINDKNYTEDVYLTESSPSIIASQKGVRNLPMLMKASHIRENVFTEEEAKQHGLKVNEYINYHGLGKDLFLKIIDGLDDVNLAYRGTRNASDPSRRENYFLLISQYKDANGNTINVPVFIDEKGQYNRVFIDTNKIATVFGRDNLSEYIQKEIKNGNLVRIKNKSTQASELTSPINASYSKNALSNPTIPQEPSGVNTSISENAENDTKNSQFYLDESNSVPLEQRVSGDDLLDAHDLIDTVKDVGAKVDGNGYITVYHRTNNQSKEKILSSGQMTAKEDGIFFSTKKDGQNAGYGSEIIEFKIPAEKLMLDDIFDDEAHLRLPLKRAGETIDVKPYLTNDTGNSQFSLSENGEHPSTVGTPLQDLYYEAPVREDIAPVAENATTESNFDAPLPNDVPPTTAEETNPSPDENTEADAPNSLEAIQTELANLKDLRSETFANYNQKIEQKQKEFDSKKNKDSKVANNLKMQIERLKRIRDSMDADYSKRINNLETRERLVREGKPTKRQEHYDNIISNVKSEFSNNGFDFDEVLKNAKNLSTFSTVDNTPQRVMEKALGYKEGQLLSDLTVNKVAQNETEGIKWLNSFTDRKNGLLAELSKQYKIKPGSKESAAAQMYAEGFYVNDNNEIIKYGDDELAQDFPDVEVRNNIKGLSTDARIRQIYDETLNAINESRTRNAYPEIPRLNNYFLHFRAMEDTFSKLGLPFNPNDIRAKDLPTDLNGATADLKPGQPYFASANHRTGKRTSFDLLGGLERYLTSAKDQIYHIDDIQTLRALRNYIADTYGQAKGLENLDSLTEEEAQERIKEVYGSHLSTFAKFLNEEANVIAGKTALIDRGLEGVIGRRGMTFLNTVNKQVGSNMVGFNISSSLTNFLPVAQAFAKTNKFDFLKAFTQTVSNKFGSIFGKGDSFAENSPVMIRRKGADRFYRTPFQKAGDVGYVLMSAVDDISTEMIARTKYNEFTRKGMDEQQAHFETDKWVSRLMGDRSLGQQPQLYNSKTLGIFTKFQLEVRNQLDSQFYDTIQEAKVSNKDIQNGLERNAKIAAKVTSTFVQLAVAQHLFGKAFESVAGYNPAFDIISVLATLFGFDDDDESEDTALDNIEQGFLELLEDLPYTSTFTGGRIPISSALPVSELIQGKDSYGNDKSRLKILGEAAPYYVLPGGYGQIKKTAQGLGMFSDEHPVSGSYTDSGNLRFPVEDTPLNRVQAGIFGQYANENAREYFDNDYAPLKEKQIQEYVDADIPISDYWKYREGLKGLKTNAEKADYINSLDIEDWQKNMLLNNILDRKEKVDMSNYDDYGSFEEFDYAEKNPEKYEFFKENGISYEDYANSDEDGKAAYTWAYNNPEKFKVAKVVSGDVVKYRSYTSDLYDIKADKDENGDTITGTGKAKKIDYINSLDLDYGQKIILFKSQYKTDNTYNAEIVEYLNNREDVSYDEMVDILTELGFTVTDDGVVKWD